MENIDSLPASSFKAELKKLLAKYNAEIYADYCQNICVEFKVDGSDEEDFEYIVLSNGELNADTIG